MNLLSRRARAAPAPAPFANLDAPVDRLRLAAEARSLLANPVLALAFQRIERDLADAWRQTAVGADDEREALYRLHWAVEALKSKLAVILGDGKVLEAEQKRRDAQDARDNAARERRA